MTSSPSETHAKAKILIAEDAPEVAIRLKQMLQDLAQVEIIGPARNGQEALQLYRHYRPFGLILDLAMPAPNGLEVLQTIRKHDKSTLIIVLTNYPDEETRLRCLQHGANYFLIKAHEFERVADILGEHVPSPE